MIEQEKRTQRGPEPEACRFAEKWLTDFLQYGPQPATTCFEEAKKVGITRATFLRAKAKVKVVTVKSGFGPGGIWTWRLPADNRGGIKLWRR